MYTVIIPIYICIYSCLPPREAWRQLATRRSDSFESSFSQLQARCEWMEGANALALAVALGHLRRCRPVQLHGPLESLVRQQRRAKEITRQIEALSSMDVMLFLQVRSEKRRHLRP